jgi:glycyl-tRNA synthetase beta chain
MPDFLLELLSEEIPARMQARAQADLERLFAEQLAAARLAAERIETFATPRRLVLIARGLPAETEPVREETRGPRAGAPPQALEGFLRKTGLARDDLVERDGVLFAVVEKPGRATSAVLAEAVPALIRAFPWPKSMRWGAASVSTESPRWVRPLQGIVALLGEEIVEFEIAGVRSGAATVGHRFHHPGIITIGGAQDYAEKLRACHVIVDPAERRRLVAEGARAAAAAAGLALVEDEGLVAENAGLTEWPVPLLGAFDPGFLEVPREVIQLTMRTNQKYFACVDPPRAALGEGDHPKGGGGVTGATLAPSFVCVANIEASDGGSAIVAGNERVLSARLSDAKFFWEQDLKVPLEAQAGRLDQIVFHEKLGTVADKVERVAKLARWLAEEGIIPLPEREGSGVGSAEGGRNSEVGGLASLAPIPSPSLPGRGALADLAERAARLAKADLVTAMVGEFPELQGVIGGHLARAQGEPVEIADAIRDHYKPAGQGDEVPTAPVTVAVSLADKLDTICAFITADLRPTGSKDPFALRRAAIASIELIVRSGLRLPLTLALRGSLANVVGQGSDQGGGHRLDRNAVEILAFFADRLKVQQREAGVRHDLIDAVFALGGEDDLVRLLARVKALQAFVETAEGTDLLAGYKRAANILKKEGWSPLPEREGLGVGSAEGGSGAEADGSLRSPPTPDPSLPGRGSAVEQSANKTLSYTPEKEEAALIAALDSAEPKARAAVEAEDFEGAMAALATLRAPVDSFFDKVTVNDPDEHKRAARLDLLARMRDAVHRVADFSKIEG